MVSIKTSRVLALKLPGAEERPHFNLASFRVKNKIFATLWEAEKRMMLKLSMPDQYVFCAMDNNIIYPVPGGWGKQGATFIDLGKVKKDILEEALYCAWKNVAPKSMVNR